MLQEKDESVEFGGVPHDVGVCGQPGGVGGTLSSQHEEHGAAPLIPQTVVEEEPLLPGPGVGGEVVQYLLEPLRVSDFGSWR